MKNLILGGLILAVSSLIGMFMGLKMEKVSERFSDDITAFACGAMLATATFGLISETLEISSAWVSVIGILCGVAFMVVGGKLAGQFHHEHHLDREAKAGKILMFILSVAIHHFPEGLATGISYRGGNTVSAFSLAGGIALHNLPEAMIVVFLLLSAGISKKKAVGISLSMIAVQFLSTLMGYGLMSIAQTLEPIGLSFAAGTIMYVIINDIIPEIHENKYGKEASIIFMIAFCLVLLVESSV